MISSRLLSARSGVALRHALVSIFVAAAMFPQSATASPAQSNGEFFRPTRGASGFDFPAPPPSLPYNANFVRANLPHGVSIDVPGAWALLGDDEHRLIGTTISSGLNLAGLPAQEDEYLLSAVATPVAMYFAAVRVTAKPPTPPGDVAAIDQAAIDLLNRQSEEAVDRIAPIAGRGVEAFYGWRPDRVAGFPALVTEFLRTDLGGSTLIQISRIFSPDRDIVLSLQYRRAEGVLWKPVLGRIRASLSIQPQNSHTER